MTLGGHAGKQSLSYHSIVSKKNWYALTAALHDQNAGIWGGGIGFYFSGDNSMLTKFFCTGGTGRCPATSCHHTRLLSVSREPSWHPQHQQRETHP